MPNEYRDRAVECWRLARETMIPEFRATLIEMAQAWMRLHDWAERNARSDIVYQTPERPPVVQQQQQQQQEEPPTPDKPKK